MGEKATVRARSIEVLPVSGRLGGGKSIVKPTFDGSVFAFIENDILVYRIE